MNSESKTLLEILVRLEDAVATRRFTDLELELENSHLQSCWELLNCEKKRCPAYGKRRVRCWHLIGTFCNPNQINPTFENKWSDCRDCLVFKKATPTLESRTRELANNIVYSMAQQDSAQLSLVPATRKRIPQVATKVKLTPREQEIVLLVAERLSRREIAKALHISDETVKMHLSNAYRKLGISSRRELSDAVYTLLKR